MPELLRIHNSRLLKFYFEYLSARYPKVDINAVLNYAGVTKNELDDPGHWFNQQQFNRFHEKSVEFTGDSAISRKVGRYAVRSEVSGPVKQYVIGLVKTSSSYFLLTKLYPLLSRGAKVSYRKLSSNRVEINVIPNPDVEEKLFQCTNRIGIFEFLATLHTQNPATVNHAECVHHGDDKCKYIASWEASVHDKWKSFILLLSGLLSVLLIVVAIFWSYEKIFILLLAICIVILGAYLRSQIFEKMKLEKVIQAQGDTAKAHIQEIDYRYRGARLVQEIGQATSAIRDMDQLAHIVVNKIQNHLDFDRGMILLADKNQKCLVYAAGFGFEDIMIDLLCKTQFRLDNSEEKNIFIRVFKTQKPVLVDDIGALRFSFAKRNYQMIEKIVSRSLLCLPIIHEDTSLGILAVDNVVTKRPLKKSDMNLLMGVAYQSAASIFSAQSFKKLERSEVRFRMLYENAPAAYLCISVEDTVIVNCNPAAVRLLGYERQHLLDTSLLQYLASNKENIQRSQRIHELLMNGQAVHNETIELIDSEQNSIWVHVSIEPIRAGNGQILEGHCILVDIPKQMYSDVTLQRSQRMETIGTLAGGVAHDLSNILAAIVSYPDLLLMDISSDSPLYEPLRKIRSAGHRAVTIVQDLLALSRRGVPISEVVDINDTVKLFLESPEFENLMARHPGINIAKTLSSNEVLVKASPVHLTKTLMNIVYNAAEAIIDKGVIHISTDHQYVDSGDHPTGKYVVLMVKDNGHGISANDLKRVFEPFFTKKVMGKSGTGLGMAIVWATVEDHQGFIEIESSVGQGTTVRLHFPVTLEKRRLPLPVWDPERYEGNGDAVMIVDDDLEHREIAQHMLTRLGYDVVSAESGEAAVSKFEGNYRPAIVVFDMMLGSGLDGLETYQKILDIHPGQRAIIASGYSESSRSQEARRLGVGAYLKKPYSLKEIGAAVRYEIDRASP